MAIEKKREQQEMSSHLGTRNVNSFWNVKRIFSALSDMQECVLCAFRVTSLLRTLKIQKNLADSKRTFEPWYNCLDASFKCA